MIIPKSGKFCCRCQEREYVKPVSRAGKLVSVILNPVTLLDLHSFRPVVYKDVFFFLFFVVHRPLNCKSKTTITEI